jgi:hypothetical protein
MSAAKFPSGSIHWRSPIPEVHFVKLMVRPLRFQIWHAYCILYLGVSLKQNFAKEENSYEKIHSIWNIGSESFRIAFGIVGAGSDGWPGLPGLPG